MLSSFYNIVKLSNKSMIITLVSKVISCFNKLFKVSYDSSLKDRLKQNLAHFATIAQH